MAGVALRRELPQLEHQIVAVRADQRHPALDLSLTGLAERRQQHAVQLLAGRGVGHRRARRTAVLQRQRPAARRQLLVGLVRERLKRGDQIEPLRQQLGTRAGQMLVPDVQRRQIHLPPAVPARQRRGFQQGVALLEDAVVVRTHPGHPRRTRGDQLVQEPPALPRVPLHQRQILRREQHRPDDPQHIPRPDLGGPVDPGAVGLARIELQLDQLLPLALDDRGPDDRPLGAHPHQRGVRGDPVAAERGEIADRLDEIGLALAVGAHESRDARIERNLDPGVRAEVGERQMRYVHCWAPTSPAAACWCCLLLLVAVVLLATSCPRPRGHRTGCAARRSSSSAASRPDGRRSARRARP